MLSLYRYGVFDIYKLLRSVCVQVFGGIHKKARRSIAQKKRNASAAKENSIPATPEERQSSIFFGTTTTTSGPRMPRQQIRQDLRSVIQEFIQAADNNLLGILMRRMPCSSNNSNSSRDCIDRVSIEFPSAAVCDFVQIRLLQPNLRNICSRDSRSSFHPRGGIFSPAQQQQHPATTPLRRSPQEPTFVPVSNSSDDNDDSEDGSFRVTFLFQHCRK